MEREARGGVLILGGGFAGAYVARLLGERGATVASLENFMLYTPLLPEAASGMIEPRHTVVPLRGVVHEVGELGERLDARIAGADEDERQPSPPRRLVQLRVGRLELPQDVIAELDPVRERLEREAVLREAGHRHRPRDRAEREHELLPAHGLHAGVGLDHGGARLQVDPRRAAEQQLGVRAHGARYYPRLRDVPRRWVLVDAAPAILPEIPSRLGAYAAHELARRGVEIHVGTTLESVTEDEATLGDGTRIPTHTLVWTAGVRPNPLLRELGLPLDERGRVEVDELLRVRGHERVWALGDCARVPNAKADHPDPPTCQHALRQARRLARNLQGEPRPYGYRMLGQVATLGRYKGIADVLGVRLRGFPGWWVTRTYHLYQLPLLSRKLRVVVDWTVALLFRRDVVELGMLGHPEGLEGTGGSPSSAPPKAGG